VTGTGRQDARAGVTLVELLVALAAFLTVLGSLSGLFVSSLRTQCTVEGQSLRIQETEGIVHLINYEVGLAGYARTQTPQAFTDATGPTIAVALGGSNGSDRIRIRFYEDADFLATGDTGERWVEYRIDAQGGSLLRTDLVSGTSEALIGGVSGLSVVAFIGRDREVVTPAAVAANGPSALPAEIAGVRVRVDFGDGSEWTFLVGLYNRQRVVVTGVAG
jgi:hypothetical protein